MIKPISATQRPAAKKEKSQKQFKDLFKHEPNRFMEEPVQRNKRMPNLYSKKETDLNVIFFLVICSSE